MLIKSTIGEVCKKLQTGKTPPSKEKKYFDGGVNWYTPTDLNKRLLEESKRTITALAYEDKKAMKYPKGTVLLSCIGDIGKVAITTDNQSSSNQQITGLIPDLSKITTQYLYYWCREHKSLFESKSTSVTLPMLNNKRLSKIKISYEEDLNKQKKIANILTQVEELISKREESIELLDALLRSSFLDMFGTNINNTQKHPVVSLSEVSNKITDGTHQSPKFQDSGIPFLLVSNIKNNEIIYTTQKYISDEEYEKLSKRTPIEIGNILLTTVGSYGNPAIIKSTKKFAFQRHIAFIQPNHEIINYYYLFAILKSPIVKHQIEKKVKGVAQKTLNLRDLKAIKIWLPERALQDKFATIVKQVESTKEQYQKSLDELRDLFGSLSQRAFRGELDLSNMKLSIVIDIKNLKKKEQTTDDIIKMASSFAQINKTMLESINKESSMYVSANKEMMKKIEEDVKQVAINNWQNEQKKIYELANLGKYNESILNFTNEYKSLVKPSFNVLNSTVLNLNNYEREFKLSTIENLGLEALQKSLEINQPYKLALEQIEAMNPLRGWGERHEALINRYSEKVEETTEVIESILNLSELMDDELFDDIFWTDSYDDIKELVYKLLDEGKLEQLFDKDKKRVVLKKVEQ